MLLQRELATAQGERDRVQRGVAGLESRVKSLTAQASAAEDALRHEREVYAEQIDELHHQLLELKQEQE